MAESRDGAVASVAQLLGAWHSLVADHGPADIEDGAICTRWADVAFSFYNCVTFSEPDVEAEELERKLLLAAGYMRRKKHVGFLWLFKELLTDDATLVLDRLVDSCGLAYAMCGVPLSGAGSEHFREPCQRCRVLLGFGSVPMPLPRQPSRRT